MVTSIGVLFSLLLSLVSVLPKEVPARGKQEVVLSVPEAGMVRVTAKSAGGTACELVDHFRGPFQRAGQRGKKNCSLDLLLDAGQYKLRLNSPKQGRGKVAIKAELFSELNRETVLLPRGRGQEQVLAVGQQASYWLRVDQRHHVLLRVYGRTAGLLRLWRDGKWVEEVEQTQEELSPVEGQPIYSWRLGGMLEPGDYRLTVYGSAPKAWTEGQERDFLFVQHGFVAGPAEQYAAIVLPAWGEVAFELDQGPVTAYAELARTPKSGVRLRLEEMAQSQGSRVRGEAASCGITPKNTVAVCAARSGSNRRHVLRLQGPPGTRGQLRWGRFSGRKGMSDGSFANADTFLRFKGVASGRYLVAVTDLPVDVDAVPLACELNAVRGTRWSISERDFLRLGHQRSFSRSVNYNGREESVWFKVQDAGAYLLSTSGALKNRCVLYRLEGGKTTPQSDPGAKACRVEGHLSPGNYSLKIYGGKSGIDKLTLAHRPGGFLSDLLPKTARNLTKSSCLLPEVKLEKRGEYSLQLNRAGQIDARGLAIRKLPLTLTKPLLLVVEAGESLRLPVAAGAPLQVRAIGAGSFGCGFPGKYEGQSKNGFCRLPEIGQGMDLEVSNPSELGLVISLHRPRTLASLPPLSVHRPRVRPLPALQLDQARFFDFDRLQSHSMVFDVAQAGLYQVSSQGLLSTACRLRTAVFPRLVADQGSGRGRNCLVSAYLQPGRYLLSVGTTGASRGRAAVSVSRKPVQKQASVRPGKQSYFRVAASALVEQKINIKKAGRYALQTTGQGVSLQCRLSDSDGWPLVAVPCSCSLSHRLGRGSYLWKQLPLTVDSMRRTELHRVRRPPLLSGEKEHLIQLNTAYAARIGADGKDLFVFQLGADLDLDFRLSGGMQARLYRLPVGKQTAELVQALPPNQVTKGLALSAGRYRLEAEHSRADVGIRYQLQVSSRMLAPGLSKELPVPATVTLRNSKDCVLRLKSEGETDLRCRLLAADGRLVAQSASHGADWNCLIATPLPAGDYRLVLEAENNISGRTQVSVTATKTRVVGEIGQDQSYRPKGEVLVISAPAPKPDTLQEFAFASPLSFSYSLEEEGGSIIKAGEDTHRVKMLVHPRGKKYIWRLWSKNWRAAIRATVASRPIQQKASAAIAAGQAQLRVVKQDGWYRTAADLWCLPAAQSGPLLACAGHAALLAGPTIFSTMGLKRRVKLSLAEQVQQLKVAPPRSVTLRRRHHIQRQSSSPKALHLLQVELPFGETVAPACRLDQGLNLQLPHVCYAASAPVHESVARWWVPSDQARLAQVRQVAAPVPKRAELLRPGGQQIVWQGPVARFALPPQPSRLELTLPNDTWAVLTDSKGAVRDLCPPRETLSRCPLMGQGGELFLFSNAARKVRLHLLAQDRPPPIRSLAGLVEFVAPGPDLRRLAIAPAKVRRQLRVSGLPAEPHCTLILEDGSRKQNCTAWLNADQAAELVLGSDGGPVRVCLSQAGAEKKTLFAQTASLPKSPVLPVGQVRALRGQLTKAEIDLTEAAVVHFLADSGVCAFGAVGRDLDLVQGLGQGCHLTRWLQPGRYQFLVRPFAQQALRGSMYWRHEKIETLVEGVGREEWIAPGQSRLFRFAVAASGRVGLGLRVEAEVLDCALLDEQHQKLGRGCQQWLELAPGSYLLEVRAPAQAPPQRFRPVLLGLSGSIREVPEQYLRDFFQRIGEKP